MSGNVPLVTVVVPCLNEEANIVGALESLWDDWLLTNGEILIVDGGSLDRTRERVRDFGKAKRIPMSGGAYPRQAILDNPGKLQAYAMNVGIAAAKGEIIVRADAHCLYPPGYVRKCVELLRRTGAGNVGGVMVPRARGGRAQEAIALAMRHPLGAGGAKYRDVAFTGYAETTYLGTFRKDLFEQVGFYDLAAGPNEDGELNFRILESGRRIFVDGSIRVVYFPRKSLAALASQYFRYGKGRAYTTFKHRKFAHWRQAGPPALALILTGSLVLGLWNPVWLFVPAAYALLLLGAAIFTVFPEMPEGSKVPLGTRFLAAAAFAVMHITWGWGFLAKSAVILAGIGARNNSESSEQRK